MSSDAQRQAAQAIVKAFGDTSKASPHVAFKGIGPLNRWVIQKELSARIDRPYLILQGDAGLCGPASLAYEVAKHDSVAYVKAVIDLYEKGRARIGKWTLEPSSSLKDYSPRQHKGAVHYADWILLASIRDCENWFFDYAHLDDMGGTSASDMADIMKKV
jgi:hypothetical protein